MVKKFSKSAHDARIKEKTSSQVEYLTTQKYIHDYAGAPGKCRILEVGAGTGRYSAALAGEGYSVTAVELFEHNLSILKKNG
ncbi:MAG: hypothetical protein J6X60_07045 [Ruminiclostridium sp.]|nr:hypothetical protein [Ruminiclostridium sp.]